MTVEEKDAIAVTCERCIVEPLKPHFLPVVRPTQFKYPVDIFGRWRGSEYSFITRYRSGFPDNLSEEFNATFTRFDHVEGDSTGTHFDVMWYRHTGQWLRLYTGVSLDEALHQADSFDGSSDGMIRRRAPRPSGIVIVLTVFFRGRMLSSCGRGSSMILWESTRYHSVTTIRPIQICGTAT